jgi:hypothetical protein
MVNRSEPPQPDESTSVYLAEVVHQPSTVPWRLMLTAYVISGPFAAALTYICPEFAPWYVNYVLLVSVLTVPLLSSHLVRSPGELAVCLCISSLPTLASAIWLLKAVVMVSTYWDNLDLCFAYAGIIVLVCITAGLVTVYFRTLFSTDLRGLAISYLTLAPIFGLPLLLWWLGVSMVEWTGVASPFVTVLTLPKGTLGRIADIPNDHWRTLFSYAGFTVALNVILLVLVLRQLRIVGKKPGF